MADKLTDKQKRFCDEYLIDLNAKQAAIRTGYSEKTAEVQASRLLSKAKVQEYIQSKQKKIEDKLDISVEWVLKRLIELNDRCLQGVPVYDKEGNETGEWKFEANAANRSLELIGKHLGMFTENVKLSGGTTNTNINIDTDLEAWKQKATPEELKNGDKLSWEEIQNIMKR